MAYTYDLTTNIGKVRMLIPDRTATRYVFEDDEIEAFLAMEDDVVKRGAALALETIASDQALTLKVMRLMDLQTDGASVARALMARATALREQSAAEEADGGFDVAEMVVDQFSFRQRIYNEALR